ncbi:MAG: YggS family pyridoxal phosphate-dependent enzyme [Salinivirgaceae bacterium]|nr:YggS family pyridoxal phosphate-dependent enzyme [Salinivirgaceae bacterium]
MSISENLNKIKSTLPAGVRLVAVSKTKPESDIMEAYNAGHRIFGENHAQEMKQKHADLPADIEWHFIGHLQTNKIKYIVDYVKLIHSIDSASLLQAVNKEAAKHGVVVDCLLQFFIATEETKFGMNIDEARQLLESDEFKAMQNVRICGVMGIGSLTDDKDQTNREFANLKQIFDTLKADYFSANEEFKELSMGMSGDYQLAIAHGSTMVRVGSSIFGQRYYPNKQ